VPRDLRSLTPPALDPEAVKRLRGAGVFRGLATAEVTALRALVLEYIPEAVTVAAAPGLMTAALAEEAVAKLRVLHEVGVLHRDPTPRNVLLVEGRHGRSVRWIDFDSTVTTVGWDVHEVCFQAEKREVRSTLVEDVMGSEREGRMPLWSRWF
jgi:tRNA A-37 threonylcarbamoyl transferase component Bud32